jgi:hypothetical protein
MKANEAPDNVIDETLKANGYTRKRFEKAVAKTIEREVNAKPDQFGAFAKNLANNALGAARAMTDISLLGWSDELEAGARAVLGENYDETVGKIRDERRQFAQDQPFLDTMATATGFAAPFSQSKLISRATDPAGSALVGATGKMGLNYRPGQPAVSNIGRLAGQGAVVGGAAGVTAATGASEPGDPGSPAGAGMIGSIGGALVNPVIGSIAGRAIPYMQDTVAPAIKALPGQIVSGFDDASRILSSSAGGQPPLPPNVPVPGGMPPTPPGALVGAAAAGNPIGDPELETALQRIYADGLNVAGMKQRRDEFKDLGYTNTVYADLGDEGVLRQARSITNKSAEAANRANEFLRPRQETMAQRIGDRSEQMIAPSVSPFEQGLAQQAIRDQTGPQLDAIMNDPIDAQALAAAVNRRPEVRAEFERSREINEGYRPENRLPDFPGQLEDQVTVPLQSAEFARQGLNVRSDRVSKDPSSLDKRLEGLYADIREDIYNAANHDVYRDLMRTRENTFGIEEASKLGAEAFSTKSAPEISLELQTLAPDQVAAYKSAFVSALKSRLDKAARGTNVSRKLDNQQMQDQLEAVFQGDTDQFKRYYDGVNLVENRMARTYNTVRGNSTTAQQLDEMDNLGDTQRVFDTLGIVANPVPTRENLQGLTRIFSKAYDPSEKIATNLGSVYFDPSKTDDFLNQLDRYNTRRDELMQILAAQTGRPLSLGVRSLLGDE